MAANTSKSPWYRRAFGENYQLRYPHRSDAAADREIAQLLETVRRSPPGRTIDVCCGNGRHLDALVRRGFHGVGVDLSPTLLGEARERSALAGALVRGDVRALPFASDFDVVVNLFTSIGYFESDQQNRRAVWEIVRMARPGGTIVIDHANADHVRATLVPHDQQTIDGVEVENEREIVGDRVVKRATVRGRDGEASVFVESVRLFRPEELRAWLIDAGLTSVEVVGGFDGRRFDRRSERMILFGSKQ